VVGVEGIGEQANQRLNDKDAGAHQDDEFYARCDEAAPVENCKRRPPIATLIQSVYGGLNGESKSTRVSPKRSRQY